MDLREIRRASTGWIYLAEVRRQWRALVNTIANFRVP
jgi:hypothetical protein